MELEIQTAKVFRPLLEPARYKGAHGGRGSGKSHFFAGLMVEEHLMFPGFRSVCFREVQKSLKDSAKRLIEDKIREFGLEGRGFTIYNDRIETPGGGLIVFMGLKDSTAETIKSLEGFDRAWVEEAQTLSKKSLRLLRPTIRKKGSQIWFSWNPRFKTDPVDVLLRGENPPSDAIVVQANYMDNPWFPDELEIERQDDKRIDPDGYQHVWMGEYIKAVEGAYYAKQLLEARQEKRIGHVRREKLASVFAYIDIGGTSSSSDAFSMWLVQFIGKEGRVLRYYEARGQEFTDHVHWLRENGYGDAIIQLPHDGRKKDMVWRVSYESAFKDAGFKTEIMPGSGKTGAALERVAAARRVFPNLYFDENGCEEMGGISALGWYHEKIDELRNVGLGPNHDWSSHAADSFGEMCLEYERRTKLKTEPAQAVIMQKQNYW